MSTANKELLLRWFDEVWDKGRAEAIDEMLAGDARVHGIGPEPLDVDGFKKFHAGYCDAFPDVTVRVHDIVAEGDMVAGRWSAAATHTGNGLGFAATNRRAQFSGMVFMQVKDGKIVEGWNAFDQLGMLQQLGAVTLATGSPQG
jgi:steroid delta-isomerase-like uncharacterized protein